MAAEHRARAEVPFGELDDTGPAAELRQRRRDKLAQRAYDAGRKGRPFSVDANSDVPHQELREHYRTGAGHREAELRTQELPPDENSDEPAAPPTPARGSARRGRAWGRPNAPQIVNDGAGFVLGLGLYALFINFVRGGRAQARGWLAAKFLNRPYGQAPSGATLGTPATNPPGGAGVPRGVPSSTPLPAPHLGPPGTVVTV